MERSLTLPSNEQEIILKPFSVGLAMQVNSHSRDFAEHYITQFLSACQPADSFSDPLKWTAQDRYFAMLDIYLHAFTAIPDMMVREMTYTKCHKCGGEHDVKVVYGEFTDSLAYLVRPLPKITFKDIEYVIKPLTGEVLEQIEIWEYAIPENPPKTPKTAKEVTAVMRELERIAGLEQAIENTKIAGYLGKTVDEIGDMDFAEFIELAGLLPPLIKKLKHGIDFTMTVKCPDDEEDKGVPLSIPFRSLNILQRV